MRICDLIREDWIRLNLTERTKETVLDAMVKQLAACGEIENGDAVLQMLLERERLMTTGVCTGFAIPHAFPENLKRSIMMFGSIPGGADWQALDKQPVHYVFLILGPPQNTGIHLRLLARLSRLLLNPTFVETISHAETPADVLRTIAVCEEAIALDGQPSGAQGG